MYRLSLKRFVVFLSAIGLVFGFMPNAAAHKNTNTVAEVTGTVTWPVGPKDGDPGDLSGLPTSIDGFDLKDEWRDTSELSILDLRHPDSGTAHAGDPLNGCRLKTGNSFAGLPLGDNPDLCFFFGDLIITSTGFVDNMEHATDFTCISSGTTGASGTSEEGDPPLPKPASEAGLGAFYGEFTCDGSPSDPGILPFVPSADGHFHGQSVGGGAEIGFLGVVHCTVGSVDPLQNCPLDDLDKPNKETSETHPGKNVFDSRIKHTLSCKGGVQSIEFDDPTNPIAIVEASVLLECVIA